MSTLYPTDTHSDATAQRYYPYQPQISQPQQQPYVPTTPPPHAVSAQPASQPYAPTPFVPAPSQPASAATTGPATIPENATTEEGLSIILASTQEYFHRIMTHLQNVDARLTALEQTTRERNSNQRSMLTQAPGPDPKEREREDEELARKLQAQFEDERKAAAAKAEPPKKPADLMADCPFCDAKLPIVEAEAHVQQHMEQEDKKPTAATPAKPTTSPAAVPQQPTGMPQVAGGYPFMGMNPMNMPPGFPAGYMPGQPVLVRAGPNGQLAYAMPQPMMSGAPSGMPQPFGLYPMDPSQAGLQPTSKQ